jgi:hypothetical protein
MPKFFLIILNLGLNKIFSLVKLKYLLIKNCMFQRIINQYKCWCIYVFW